jgi:cobalt/nickel transport protein
MFLQHVVVFLFGFLTIFSLSAEAHFGVIMPSQDIVDSDKDREITLNVMFMHPFEGGYMNMEKPAKFSVMAGGNTTDLLPTLKEKTCDKAITWEARYSMKRPGDHIFYVEPVPYWEPAEESFIVHYTKVVVNAFGKEQGWDEELGIKTEIVPLTRPYGLWTGNIFQGIVKVDGKAVPFAAVEVEYFNDSQQKIKAPGTAFVTQVIKADNNGVFTYAMPKAGWWGFSALKTADFTLKHENKDYPVELGAVIWVRTHDMK